MSISEDLVAALSQVEGVEGQVEDARSSIAAALDRADDAVEVFEELGGSAERAQAVRDVVEELQGRVASVPDGLAEATGAVREVDPSRTPEENVATLSAAIEHIGTTTELLGACAGEADDAIDATNSNLDGSSAAEDITAMLQGAKDTLEQGRDALVKAGEAAEAQRSRFAGN